MLFSQNAFVAIEKWTVGSLLHIMQVCSQCNGTFNWDSQPYIGKAPASNILISAAILYTGWLPAKALRMLRTLNCSTITRKNFFPPSKELFAAYN